MFVCYGFMMIATKRLYPGTLGGKPMAVVPHTNNDGFDGKVKGDNPTSSRPCASWNLDRKHLQKHVDADGKCKFKHGICDQFVSDKGPTPPYAKARE